MEEFLLRINTENDAFRGENLRPELARILRDLANTIDGGFSLEGPIRDANGNKVGYWIQDERED